MKKIWLSVILGTVLVSSVFAQNEVTEMKSDVKEAQIVFEKTTHDFGTFSESDPVVSCTFTFTNKGTAPLVIHQAIASCGCTVPTYTRMPIKPGEQGKIDITYNGHGKYPGRFKKSITVRTNSKDAMVRLYVTGNMTEAKSDSISTAK